MKSKSIVVDMAIQIISQSFTTDPQINYIINKYDSMKDNPLNRMDLKNILKQTKLINTTTRGVLVFYVEKLLTMLLEIFSKVQDKDGSNEIFEAILYVINLFKTKKEDKK